MVLVSDPFFRVRVMSYSETVVAPKSIMKFMLSSLVTVLEPAVTEVPVALVSNVTYNFAVATFYISSHSTANIVSEYLYSKSENELVAKNKLLNLDEADGVSGNIVPAPTNVK